jgi:hypothetical protein
MPHAFLIIAITSLLLLISICGYCVWKPDTLPFSSLTPPSNDTSAFEAVA